jgi:hypothetical protein
MSRENLNSYITNGIQLKVTMAEQATDPYEVITYDFDARAERTSVLNTGGFRPKLNIRYRVSETTINGHPRDGGSAFIGYRGSISVKGRVIPLGPEDWIDSPDGSRASVRIKFAVELVDSVYEPIVQVHESVWTQTVLLVPPQEEALPTIP